MTRRILLSSGWMLVCALIVSGAALAGEAGPFSPPVNGFQTTQNFNTSVLYGDGGPDYGWCFLGGKDDSSKTSKAQCEGAGGKWMYGHTGTDLADGTEGKEVRAIADGTVVNTSKSTSWGRYVLVSHTLPNASKVCSLYAHLQDMSVPASVSDGKSVAEAQVIGRVGSTGTSSTSPHLHITVTRYCTIGEIAGYLYGDTGNRLRNYFDALLFVDDRNSSSTSRIGLLANQWTIFQVSRASSSATAYVTSQGGSRYSLRRASTFNLIYSYIYVNINGTWQSYSDPEKIIFEPGKSYAIYTYVSNATLTLFYAGNNYPSARGRQDMVEAARRDPSARFGAAKRETYQENLSWDPNWELRYMNFNFSGGRRVTIYQATNKSNALLRFTQYYDPDKGAWTPWEQRY